MTLEELKPLIGKQVYTAYGSVLELIALHGDVGLAVVKVMATNPWHNSIIFEDLYPTKPKSNTKE